MNGKSRPPDYFEKLYAENPDPWDFETSSYEQEKYQSTIALLGDRRFKNAFEAGCSIGVLTRQLAEHCDRLLAVDVAQNALATAEARCRDLNHVIFQKRRLPGEWPDGEVFDLMLFSEMLYFLTPADIAETAHRARHALAPRGLVMLVNYIPPIDEPCGGEEAAQHFINACGLAPAETLWRTTYRIDVLRNEVPCRDGRD